MPYNCSVFNCNSTTKTTEYKFHSFPQNVTRKRTWLIAIRSGKRPSKHSKVCEKHFKESDYILTSLGQWKILKKDAIPSLHLPKTLHDKVKPRSTRSNRTSTCPVTAVDDIKDLNITESNMNNELQGESEEFNNKLDAQVQTIVTLKRSQLICFTFLTDKQLHHMTGFHRKLFNFFCQQFGNKYTKTHLALSIEDELLLTLIKYRLNFYYATLATLFDIDPRTVSTIVTKWSKHMYKCFKQINVWQLRSVQPGQYTVVLDCTEIRIERSADPLVQQASYSTYYGTNTFKILVGGTENGQITFISDIYGGCITDRKITEVSGILEVLQEGDFVLADRGLDISDLLEEKHVHLNIPPFKRSNQLTEEEIFKTRAIANRRIVIENLIGAAKKNLILVHRMSKCLWDISNEIVYNCLMFVNFKNSIVTCENITHEIKHS